MQPTLTFLLTLRHADCKVQRNDRKISEKYLCGAYLDIDIGSWYFSPEQHPESQSYSLEAGMNCRRDTCGHNCMSRIFFPSAASILIKWRSINFELCKGWIEWIEGSRAGSSSSVAQCGHSWGAPTVPPGPPLTWRALFVLRAKHGLRK